jgi:hypothetical protein
MDINKHNSQLGRSKPGKNKYIASSFSKAQTNLFGVNRL